MNIAYKYMVAGGDFILVFPYVEDDARSEDVVIGHTILDNRQWLKVGNSMYAPLDDEAIHLLRRTKNIILTDSDAFEYRISYRGEIELDPVHVGQIIAYYEIGKGKIEDMLRSENELKDTEIISSAEGDPA